MNKTKREIECLQRLQDLTGQLEDVLQFLKLEGLVTDAQIKTVRLSPDGAKDLQIILKDLKQNSKVQLLQFEWSILPVENISLQIVTDRNQKEFIYQG